MPKNYGSKMPMHKMPGGHMMKNEDMPKSMPKGMPPKGMPMKPKKSGKK